MGNYLEEIKELESDISSIKIQGATNVAMSTVRGMKIAFNGGGSIEEVLRVGERLANTRLNEPMARNAVKYIKHMLKAGADIDTLIDEYGELIKKSKIKIREVGAENLHKYNVILTHCHSSTSTAILVELSKNNKDLKIVSTETRPKYQGRLTSKELVEAGIDVTMVVDSVASSFIVDDRYLPVEAIIIGTDELLRNGIVINKVGSYQMALAAKNGNDDFYVATSLLKLDPERDESLPEVEMREASEVWEEAPENLKIINPAFEWIPPDLITGYITEAGLLRSKELLSKAKEIYPWI